MKTAILAFLLTSTTAAAAEPKLFPSCGGAAGKSLAAVNAKITALKARHDAIAGEASSAAPAKCGKGLPEPPVHAKLKEYAAAAHEITAKLMKAKKGTKAEACRKEIDRYLTESEAAQRRLYETVEKLCR